MELRRSVFNLESVVSVCALVAILLSLAGCTAQRRKSDAELGLTPQQSAGRRIYDDRCDRCHEAYSSRGKKGPSLQGIFKGQYLSKSGLPSTDDQVGDIVRYGRTDMPAYGDVLNQQQIKDLLAYMHTL